MSKRNHSLFFLLSACLLLAACSNAKEQLGLTRSPPDEFTVVKRAPLALPPDYTLRPPQPGAPRPQEQAVQSRAREAVFGGEQAGQAAPAGSEALLLQQTGATETDPDIRAVVDRETATLEPEEKPVAERLLGWTGGKKDLPPATVVDAQAEAERLKENAAAGKPATEGETPTVSQ